jgi:predicted N-acetyltransferase YhbS
MKKKAIINNNKTIAEIIYSTEQFPYGLKLTNTIYIESVWVDKNHRKEGLGSKLIRDILEQNKQEKIFVECTSGSKKFWEKIGFNFKGNKSLIESKNIKLK